MTPALTAPLAAFLAGLITSLHCAGMCGPLACAACARGAGAGSLPAALAYHGSRLLSYSALGLLAGALGRSVSDVLLGGSARWLTWAFVVFFVLAATGLDRRMGLPMAGRWMSGCLGREGSVVLRAGTLGSLTPFIPCGPLYLMVATASISGSALSGLALMAAFAAGTVPLVLILQSQYVRLNTRLNPSLLDFLRRSLAAVSVVLLVYRGTADPSLLCK